MSIIPPIIVYDKGDISVFSSISLAQNYLEPIDIPSYEVFDSQAKRLTLISKKIEKRVIGFRIKVDVVEIIDTNDPKDCKEELRKRIIKFLSDVRDIAKIQLTQEEMDQLSLDQLIKIISEVALVK